MMGTGLTKPECKSWTSNGFKPLCLTFHGIRPKSQKTALALASLFYPLNKCSLIACEEPDTAMHCKWLLLSLRPTGREEQSNWWEEEKQRGRTGLGQETPLSSRIWSCPEPWNPATLSD